MKVEIIKSPIQPLSLFTNLNDHQLLFSPVSLFEMSAKGAKYVNSGKLIKSDVINGINSLVDWELFKSTNPWMGEVQRLAFDFREQHSDYIDCLILSSAIIYANILISEDEIIKELTKLNSSAISNFNANFSVKNASEVNKEFVKNTTGNK